MKYIKQYNSKTDYSIFYQDESETKFVIDGEKSPKVIEWLKSHEFEIIEYVPIPLEELKSQRIIEFKNNAKSELETTDYKVIRHYEQTISNTETTLTNNEFIILMAQRQAIRDKSNSLEELTNQATTIEELNEIEW